MSLSILLTQTSRWPNVPLSRCGRRKSWMSFGPFFCDCCGVRRRAFISLASELGDCLIITYSIVLDNDVNCYELLNHYTKIYGTSAKLTHFIECSFNELRPFFDVVFAFFTTRTSWSLTITKRVSSFSSDVCISIVPCSTISLKASVSSLISTTDSFRTYA